MADAIKDNAEAENGFAVRPLTSSSIFPIGMLQRTLLCFSCDGHSPALQSPRFAS
jgi:hypothetical protein